MRRILFSIVSAGAFLCVQPAFSQAAGGGMPQGRNPATTAPTLPNQTTPGQGPDANRDSSIPDTPASKIDDRKFAKDVALSGMTEVELGKLATEKASRDDIKQFGQKMVNDRTKANDLLKEVATKENFAIPDTIDSKHQSRVAKLSKLSGEEFDRAYVKDQLKDHQTAVRDFEAEAKNGTDANMKAFASNMLPTLQQHLELAKNLNKVEKDTAKQSKVQ
jgi:putative membrane protein